MTTTDSDAGPGPDPDPDPDPGPGPDSDSGTSSGGGRPAPVDLDGLTRRQRWNRGTVLEDGSKLVWWREMVIAVAVYLFYESIRNRSKANPGAAFENAKRIIAWQEKIGIYHEKSIQDWALNFTPLIIVSNYFYGTAYIVVTVGTLIWLYQKRPEHYRLWRTTLAIGTLIGLIGFATFPLMPPRLLDLLGDGQVVYGYVDTLVKYPTFWSFESETMQQISNQFAAMPSLHCGWALWSFAALFPLVKSWWAKVLVTLYPIATVSVVVLTGNHYFLDAVGGLVIFVIGYGAARLIGLWRDRWRASRHGGPSHLDQRAQPNESGPDPAIATS